LFKLFERFVNRFCKDYLKGNRRLTNAKSGFKCLHSTVTSLIYVTARWLQHWFR